MVIKPIKFELGGCVRVSWFRNLLPKTIYLIGVTKYFSVESLADRFCNLYIERQRRKILKEVSIRKNWKKLILVIHFR